MRAVVQRVTEASVRVGEELLGEIGPGLVILLGIARWDTGNEARWLADKIVGLRIFTDALGKMNQSLLETRGEALVVSQFTLYGDCQKGRRPSFVEAAPPEAAQPLYQAFIDSVRALGVRTQTGRFGAMMRIMLENDGPVTLILDRAPARTADIT